MNDPVNSTGGVQPSQHPQHQPNTKKEDVEVSYQQYQQTQNGLVNTAAAYSDTQGPTNANVQSPGNQEPTNDNAQSTSNQKDSDKSSDSDDPKAQEKQQVMKHMRSEGQQRRQGIKKEYQDEKQIAEES